jgi:riboflavin kinase/FMN adenylyltransferase
MSTTPGPVHRRTPVREPRWTSLAEIQDGLGPCAVVIGTLDGVHRGHQQLLQTARRRSRTAGLAVGAVTFTEHPLRVLAPAVLTDLDRKARLLHSYGAKTYRGSSQVVL